MQTLSTIKKMNESDYGYRVWELQPNGIPKEVKSGVTLDSFKRWLSRCCDHDSDSIDMNKTYKIRIGKTGLK